MYCAPDMIFVKTFTLADFGPIIVLLVTNIMTVVHLSVCVYCLEKLAVTIAGPFLHLSLYGH